jgi:hypothetical protein
MRLPLSSSRHQRRRLSTALIQRKKSDVACMAVARGVRSASLTVTRERSVTVMIAIVRSVVVNAGVGIGISQTRRPLILRRIDDVGAATTPNQSTLHRSTMNGHKLRNAKAG